MNTIDPATETLDCAGIRRMEFGQPLPLGEERVAGARAHHTEMGYCSSSAAENPHAVGDAQIAGNVFIGVWA